MENLEILKGIVSDETYATLEVETKDSKIRLGDLSTDKYVSADKYKDLEKQLGKSRAVFPNDDALLKMLYLAQVDITKKWTGRCRNCGEIHSQLEIFFADRLPE